MLLHEITKPEVPLMAEIIDGLLKKGATVKIDIRRREYVVSEHGHPMILSSSYGLADVTHIGADEDFVAIMWRDNDDHAKFVKIPHEHFEELLSLVQNGGGWVITNAT
jgi:hypothetical protein